MTSSLILRRAVGASRRIRPPIRPINSDAFSRTIAAAVLVGVLGCFAAGALAQDKRAIVQERRAAMKAQGEAMGGVKRYVDGAADQNAAAQSAGELVRLTRG